MSHSTTACRSCGAKNRVPAIASGRPRCGRCSVDLPWLVDANDNDFDEVVVASSVPVLVDCWAEWCPPCRALSPTIESLASRFAGRAKFVKVNTESAPMTAGRLGVRSIPALFVFARGEVVEEMVGAQPEATLAAVVERAIDGM